MFGAHPCFGKSAGVSIAVYGVQTYHSPDARSSESVAYTLDGAAPVVNATIELQGSPTVFMFPLFDSGPLPDGQHTLEVRNDGTTLILTYFKVGLAGGAESSPASSVKATSRTTSSTSEWTTDAKFVGVELTQFDIT